MSSENPLDGLLLEGALIRSGYIRRLELKKNWGNNVVNVLFLKCLPHDHKTLESHKTNLTKMCWDD